MADALLVWFIPGPSAQPREWSGWGFDGEDTEVGDMVVEELRVGVMALELFRMGDLVFDGLRFLLAPDPSSMPRERASPSLSRTSSSVSWEGWATVISAE